MPRKTIHGIDLHAPGGLEALFAYRRAQFGDAQMNANAGEGGDGGEGGQGNETQQPAAQPTEPITTVAAEVVEWDGKVESLPAGAQKLINDLRKADGDERVAAKTLAALQKVLNPDAPDGGKPDADQLAKDLAARDSEARQAKTELAVFRAADKHGADAAALLDSRTFLAKIAEIDPSKTADLEKAIKDAVTENPKFKLARAAGASGADFTGGTGEQRKTPTTLADALSKHYSV